MTTPAPAIAHDAFAILLARTASDLRIDHGAARLILEPAIARFSRQVGSAPDVTSVADWALLKGLM